MGNNGATHGKVVTRRRALAVTASLAAAGLMGWRIAWVNANENLESPLVVHQMGEWVELNGAFLEEASAENTRGYSLRVADAELLSRNEFVARYSGGTLGPVEGFDVPCMCCVTLDVRNEGAQGGLDLLSMVLIPRRGNEQLVYDDRLYLAGEEKLRSLGGSTAVFMGYIRTRENTEYTTHIPYMVRGIYQSSEESNLVARAGHLEELTDTSYRLYLSNRPIRHVVEVEVR